MAKGRGEVQFKGTRKREMDSKDRKDPKDLKDRKAPKDRERPPGAFPLSWDGA
jgi:hypothetical protein